MEALDLAVITARPETWRAALAVCATHHPLPGIGAEGRLGALRPDFGPAYRAAIVRLDPAAPADAPARVVQQLRAPYTVVLGTAAGLPEGRLRPGDVAISRAIRSTADPRGSHAIDAGLLRGALALDAVDHRWTGRIAAPPPAASDEAPRLVAGTLASGPVADASAGALRAIAALGHRFIAVDLDGVDAAAAATAAALEGLSGRVVMLCGVDRIVPAAGELLPPPATATDYAAAAAAAFLEAWVRHAWPTRPASAATGQTPKGVRVPGRPTDPPVTTSTTTTAARRALGAPRPRAATTSPSRPAVRPASTPPGPSTRSGPLPIAPRRARAPTGPMPSSNESKYATPGSGPVSLRARLARIYPSAEDARRVVDEAGLPADRIDFAGGADVRWHKILTEARLVPDGIERLLAVIVREGH